MSKVTKVCQYCGTPYTVRKSQEKRSKFCSDKCFRASKKTSIPYKCDGCGQMVNTHLSKIKEKDEGKRKYICCSKECFDNIQKPKFKDIQIAFDKRNYILLSKEYISAKNKLEYICPKHKDKGVQSITYNNLKNGHGCRYCGFEKTASKKRNSFKKVAKAFGNKGLLLLEQKYINSNQLLSYICLKHKDIGVQKMSYSNVLSNSCPYCSTSKGETKILDYLLADNIKYEPQKSFDDLTGLGGGLLSYDFYLPTYNLLIEYQGEYHDGTAGNQTPEDFASQQEHDKRKKEYAHKHNIELLEIWYWDFKNTESILEKCIKSLETHKT